MSTDALHHAFITLHCLSSFQTYQSWSQLALYRAGLKNAWLTLRIFDLFSVREWGKGGGVRAGGGGVGFYWGGGVVIGGGGARGGKGFGSMSVWGGGAKYFLGAEQPTKNVSRLQDCHPEIGTQRLQVQLKKFRDFHTKNGKLQSNAALSGQSQRRPTPIVKKYVGIVHRVLVLPLVD